MDHGQYGFRRFRAGLGTALAVLAGPLSASEAVPPPQVLIAAEHSALKDRIVGRLVEGLRGDGHTVTVGELAQLPDTDWRRYRVIVLINSCRAWRPASEVHTLLKNATPDERARLVVVTTANSGACQLPVAGVDAVSAASKRADPEALAHELLTRVRARLTAP